MKLIIVLSIAVAALVVADETYYAPVHGDSLDIEAVISSDQLKGFYGCFTDTSPCNDMLAEYKKDLPEVIQQACAKCTPAQKHIVRRFIEGLKEKLPQEYSDFKHKFDPENKYFANLETALANA